MYRDGLAYRYLGKSRLSAEAEYLSMRGSISAAENRDENLMGTNFRGQVEIYDNVETILARMQLQFFQ